MRLGKFSRSAVAALAMLGVISSGPARADSLPRIASMNVCTDQLLMTLADPEQILGLSRYARERFESFAADAAGRYRILSGGAEDILMLRPDIVVVSQCEKR